MNKIEKAPRQFSVIQPSMARMAIGAVALKRGRVRSLMIDHLDVRRLHVRELVIDSGMPR
jgi:hypothetical protein